MIAQRAPRQRTPLYEEFQGRKMIAIMGLLEGETNGVMYVACDSDGMEREWNCGTLERGNESLAGEIADIVSKGYEPIFDYTLGGALRPVPEGPRQIILNLLNQRDRGGK